MEVSTARASVWQPIGSSDLRSDTDQSFSTGEVRCDDDRFGSHLDFLLSILWYVTDINHKIDISENS